MDPQPEPHPNAQRLYDALLRATDDGFWRVGPGGRILEVNDAYCRMSGYNREELGRLGIRDLDPSVSTDLVRARESEIRATGSGHFETRHRAKDGHFFDVEIRIVHLADQNQDVVFLRDITERRRREEDRLQMEGEILRRERMESLASLSDGVAHDMNNVLAAIQGMASVLRARHAADPALAKSLDTILSASQRGRKVVQNLSDFAHQGMEEPRLLDLNELLRENARLLHLQDLPRIHLAWDLAEPLPPVMGDAGAFGRALLSLCGNALDAMPEGGTLGFRTWTEDTGWLDLTVSDTGVGMSPEVLARAMEPFFTTKPPEQGTGLGLSVVYGTVKAHMGSVQIQSEPGLGTTVRLRIPVWSQEGLA
jgi:two-component system, cell cycle sensor histidine kinase and response regulator CckA